MSPMSLRRASARRTPSGTFARAFGSGGAGGREPLVQRRAGPGTSPPGRSARPRRAWAITWMASRSSQAMRSPGEIIALTSRSAPGSRRSAASMISASDRGDQLRLVRRRGGRRARGRAAPGRAIAGEAAAEVARPVPPAPARRRPCLVPHACPPPRAARTIAHPAAAAGATARRRFDKVAAGRRIRRPWHPRRRLPLLGPGARDPRPRRRSSGSSSSGCARPSRGPRARRTTAASSRRAGVDPRVDRLARASCADLPFTVKDDLRSDENFPYGFLTVRRDRLVRLHSSSGTTGRPTAVFHTRRDLGGLDRPARALALDDRHAPRRRLPEHDGLRALHRRPRPALRRRARSAR